MMEYYHEHAVVDHDAHPESVNIDLGGEIICGEFVDVERDTFQDKVRALHQEEAQSEYKPWVRLNAEEYAPPEDATTYKTPLDIDVPVGAAEPVEVRLGGFGGQGIILSGKIIGRAAGIYQESQVSLTRSYGPEARGGACSSALIISDGPILYPHVTRSNLMVMMSQAAYAKYRDQRVEGSLLLVDADLVDLKPKDEEEAVPIPATHIADDELGLRIVANIVMLGALTALTDVLTREAMEQAVLDSVPEGTGELNSKAFQRGYEYAMELRE
jgi:2-oxoglutarate ferredoxin oxidoreductase subunit gamma